MRVDSVTDAVIVGLLVQHSQVKVFAGEEAQYLFGDVVIHDGVELIALQPELGLVPDLANDVGLRLDSTHATAEFMPEGDVVDLGRDVQPPDVDAQPNPAFSDDEQKLAHGRYIRIELWQSRQVPPAAVANR